MQQNVLLKSTYGIYHNNYENVGKQLGSKFHLKLFKGSRVLSDLNRIILYYNLPLEQIIMRQAIPRRLFPPPDITDPKQMQCIPNSIDIIEYFETNHAFSLPNLVVMLVEKLNS